MSRAAAPGREDGPSNSVILLLSLKLILLAFFILLNALSEFEHDRARAVIDSVNRAFRGDMNLARDATAYGQGLGALPESRDLIEEVGGLFESVLPSARRTSSERATSLAVDLPVDTLFLRGKAQIQTARRVLIRRLARALLRERGADAVFRLEVLYGVAPPGSDAGATAPVGIEVRRAGLLARRLLAEGLPPEALSIGLLPGLPGQVRFVLRAESTEPTAAAEGAAGAVAGAGAAARP